MSYIYVRMVVLRNMKVDTSVDMKIIRTSKYSSYKDRNGFVTLTKDLMYSVGFPRVSSARVSFPSLFHSYTEETYERNPRDPYSFLIKTTKESLFVLLSLWNMDPLIRM